MKWTFVAIVTGVYISSIVVLVLYFPSKDDADVSGILRFCDRRMQILRRQMESKVNKTISQPLRLNASNTKGAEFVQLGPGAYGAATNLDWDGMSPEDVQERTRLLRMHDYDAFVSDMVSVHRQLPDIRPQACRSRTYGPLPTASIIIPFRDERLSVLLRTVYSLLRNTPTQLLTEIILIDDGSTTNELKTRLDTHLRLLPKVRVIRMRESVGLMVARQAGIDSARADYFVCMDCHVELVTGWLEPLLQRLIENPKACLQSNVGTIRRDNFATEFKWKQTTFPMFLFMLDEIHEPYRKEFLEDRNTSEPIPLGMVQGMVIAMKKSWFQTLGGFDPGMKVWGGEQVELSVKVWTCGGVVEMVPCSWVAHLFKKRVIWDVGVSRLTNVLRVAEVWLDQYKDVLREYWPNLTEQTQIDVGPDLAKRKLIRRKLHCKPFQYYVDTVRAFGHIHFPVDNIKHGWLINNGIWKCLDLKEDVLALSDCSMYIALYQFFEYTSEQHLRHRGLCVCSDPNGKSSLTLAKCFSVASNISTWNYTAGFMKHVSTGKCLTVTREALNIVLEPCLPGESRQLWGWKLWNT